MSISKHNPRFGDGQVNSLCLAKVGDLSNLVDKIREDKNLNDIHYELHDYTDGPFLREAHWRTTWGSYWGLSDLGHESTGLKSIVPVCQYRWEGHLDKTLPTGASLHMPENWFAQDYGLKLSSENNLEWLDENGSTVFQSRCAGESQYVVAMKEREFYEYCSTKGFAPMWVLIHERTSWPRTDESAYRRRTETLYWLDGKKLNKLDWPTDTPEQDPDRDDNSDL